jgi:hypothetical protein
VRTFRTSKKSGEGWVAFSKRSSIRVHMLTRTRKRWPCTWIWMKTHLHASSTSSETSLRLVTWIPGIDFSLKFLSSSCYNVESVPSTTRTRVSHVMSMKMKYGLYFRCRIDSWLYTCASCTTSVMEISLSLRDWSKIFRNSLKNNILNWCFRN